MRILQRTADRLPDWRGCVATIGNFDGIHRGHQIMFERLQAEAAQLQLPVMVISFEPLPLELLAPDKAPVRLTNLREKAVQLARLNIDYLLCLRFNRQLASLTATQFCEQLLHEQWQVKSLLIGDDFRFGRGRDGDETLLRKLGADLGFSVTAIPTQKFADDRISSTRIRQALADADMTTAATLLGRPYSHIGRVIHGEKRGRQLGFPTLNMDLQRTQPAIKGIFASRVHGLAATPLNAISYIGTRPVFHGERLLLETHVLDFDDDCYGRCVEVELLQQLRTEQPFTDANALVEQMQKDVKQARDYFAVAI
ncbi:MAG: bifunctional riboflavin kinase/FAD synthetase [Gammaproteobacteria bacterium]